MSEVNTDTKIETKQGYPSSRMAWTTLFILAFTYMFSFLDRQILILLIDPIKTDLNITDTQVSLLSGFAFAIVYTITGIFMGRAADLWVRKYVIIIGVTIWSFLTMACGFAQNFAQLFLARMGVGFGEAALTPTAYAMIPDLFPPERLGRAMSIFVVVGVVGGSGASLLMGGFVIGMLTEMDNFVFPIIGEIQLWQAVLLVVGFASLCMVIPLSLMKEPKRQAAPVTVQTNLSFKAVLEFIISHKAFYFPFTLAVCFLNIVGYGLGAWMPSYFIRVQGWEASTTGITFGLIYIPCAVVGGLFAGWLSDKLRSKGDDAAPLKIMIVSLIGYAICIPCIIYIPLIEFKLSALACSAFSGIIPSVLFPAVLQQATPAHIRAQVSAIFLFVINMAGLGFGVTSVALLTDYLFHDEMAVGHSMMIIGTVCTLLFVLILVRAIQPFKAQLAKLG